MHNQIDYTNLPNAKEQALADVLDWLSEKQVAALRKVVALDTSPDQFAFYMSFCGIHGYPVGVFYEYLKQTANGYTGS